jgi:uncharacterized membrane protein
MKANTSHAKDHERIHMVFGLSIIVLAVIVTLLSYVVILGKGLPWETALVPDASLGNGAP